MTKLLNSREAIKADLVDGKYSIRDLIDIEKLKRIFHLFSDTTGNSVGFVSYPDGELLIGAGWRDICTKFHRVHLESLKICEKSDAIMVENLNTTGQLKIISCGLGLMDGATPIVIKGKHLATLISGQVFFKEPDIDFYKRQAKLFDYNEKEYLVALKKVPVVSEEKFKATISWLGEMASLIAELGYTKLEINEKNLKLETDISEIERADAALREGESLYKSLYKSLVETTNTGYVVVDLGGKVVDANQEYVRLTGHATLDEIRGKGVVEWTACSEKEKNAEAVKKCIEDGFVRNLEIDYKDAKGKVTPIEINATVVNIRGVNRILTLCRDISGRKKIEKNMSDSLVLQKAMLDNVPAGIIIYNSKGQCINASRSAGLIIGANIDQVLKQNFRQLESWKRAGMLDVAEKTLITGVPQQATGHFISTFGKECWLYCQFVPVMIENEQHLLLMFSDIGDRVKIENELNAKLHDLEIFNNVAMGREERIIELKEELKRIKSSFQK